MTMTTISRSVDHGRPVTSGFETVPVEARRVCVFVVDDHTIVRDGLKIRISAQTDMMVVGEAESGRLAFERIEALEDNGSGVDLVVVDVSMPDGNGADTTGKLLRRWPHIKVLALSMHEDKSYLRSLLEAGASGYVLKRSATEELIRAIRVVAAGGTYLDPSLSAAVADVLVRGKIGIGGRAQRRDSPDGIPLSAREEEVLKLIAMGFTNKEIAAKASLSVKTVETYKARSMEKLGLDNRADIVRYAVVQGWLNNLE